MVGHPRDGQVVVEHFGRGSGSLDRWPAPLSVRLVQNGGANWMEIVPCIGEIVGFCYRKS
jgi:hypothetical protein